MDQHTAHLRLISAIVALSLKDAAHACRGKTLSPMVSEAMDFIFLHSAGYLALLDIDAEQFRKRLIEYVHDGKKRPDCNHHLSDFEKRCFRMNYSRWYEEKLQIEEAA